MSIHSIDERPDEAPREDRGGLPLNLSGSRTPLAAELDEIQATWLLDHVCNQWELFHKDLGDWRGKMDCWREMSKEDYGSRVGKPDPNKPDARPDVFSFQNDTLGMAAAFWDYYNAQARNDIFGTKPWLSATPEGRADMDLAELITRHSQWKLLDSNIEEVAKDAISVAGWGGTAFVKSRWHRETETFKRSEVVAHSAADKLPIVHPETGEFIREKSDLEALDLDGSEVFWKAVSIEETQTVFDNAQNTLLDHWDVAFDQSAPKLDLRHTDFFARFRMGILDAAALYRLEDEQMNDLRMSLAGTDEQAGPRVDATSGIFGFEDNPVVSLVEGFVRCDPFQTGRPLRIHVVFSPQLRILFNIDYLANVTPDGMLPVFPVRIHKEAGKILGMGWFQKYENANNAVDRQYNAVTKRNAESSSVISGLQPDALADKSQAKNFTMDPTKPLLLAPGRTLAEALSFTAIPDVNERSVQLLNQMLQMNQMRSGITSAAQGEMTGVPNASTATGVLDLQSRGAILLKSQIDETTADIENLVEYNVILVYANQDHDETFTWGEGTSSELLELKADAVAGLRMNVQLTLVQAQNAKKLENAMAAINIIMQWLQVPEHEKPAVRPAFVQAVASLSFRNAEDIIRQAAVDPIGILSLLPPDMVPLVEDAFISAGLMEGPEQPDDATTPQDREAATPEPPATEQNAA